MTRFYFDDADDYKFGNMGRLEHEGKIYVLEEGADFTSRQITERSQDYNFFELSALAHDLSGNKYSVYWVFEDEGKELDEYDYSDIDRIIEI